MSARAKENATTARQAAEALWGKGPKGTSAARTRTRQGRVLAPPWSMQLLEGRSWKSTTSLAVAAPQKHLVSKVSWISREVNWLHCKRYGVLQQAGDAGEPRVF